ATPPAASAATSSTEPNTPGTSRSSSRRTSGIASPPCVDAREGLACCCIIRQSLNDCRAALNRIQSPKTNPTAIPTTINHGDVCQWLSSSQPIQPKTPIATANSNPTLASAYHPLPESSSSASRGFWLGSCGSILNPIATSCNFAQSLFFHHPRLTAAWEAGKIVTAYFAVK